MSSVSWASTDSGGEGARPGVPAGRHLTVADGTGPLAVTLPIGRCTPPVVTRLKEVRSTHPGTTEVHLRLQNGPRTTTGRLDDKLRVAPSPTLMGDLKQLLGPACLS